MYGKKTSAPTSSSSFYPRPRANGTVRRICKRSRKKWSLHPIRPVSLAYSPSCLSTWSSGVLGLGGDRPRARSLETIESLLIYHPVRMQRNSTGNKLLQVGTRRRGFRKASNSGTNLFLLFRLCRLLPDGTDFSTILFHIFSLPGEGIKQFSIILIILSSQFTFGNVGMSLRVSAQCHMPIKLYAK